MSKAAKPCGRLVFELQMIIDRTQDEHALRGPCDVIVVGSGAVGSCMAVDLARSGLRVLLLEAGPAKATQSSQDFFVSASSSGHELAGLHVGRFRCLGGTTNFWGGQLVPFEPHILKGRPELEAPGWPIGFSDLREFYDRAFNLLGMAHVLRSDAEVWERLKVAAPPQSEDVTCYFTRWAPESNFAVLFDDAFRKDPNLQVVLNAPVRALECGHDGRVTGVQLATATGTDRPVILRAPHVVLANGTIEIARLLQLPLADGGVAPWAGNLWIGRGFMDHLDCYAGQVHPRDKRRFAQLFENGVVDGIKYMPKLRLSNTAQAREGLLDISAHFVFNSSFSEHLANLKILAKGIMRGRLDIRGMANPLRSLAAFRFLLPMTLRYLRHQRIASFSDAGILLRLTSEQSPRIESRICLSEDRDPLGVPNVEVDWQIDEDDVRSISAFGHILADYLEREGIATVKLVRTVSEADPALLGQIDDANHQMGGARMSASPADGVVDANLAVHGVRGLYVAGAAVYPSSGFGNPTFTAIALGLRLAAHLRALVGAGDRAREVAE